MNSFSSEKLTVANAKSVNSISSVKFAVATAKRSISLSSEMRTLQKPKQ